MHHGGTLNADFQCGTRGFTVFIGVTRDVLVVLNSCKDFRPSLYWVCICFSGPRYVHVDGREFGVSVAGLTSKNLREHMARALKARFGSVDEIWELAKALDLPRIDLRATPA